ncbi:uncharacterized protein LOC131597190 [Vicia villosa]|uniref:uncharacterized protein LOC131597190 n=1 Tax=Vicia villosa TaxID=3911 RepID=UPI00273AF778|nr:uncharacterized protein LOC131597190 [Vicia villosa]
MATGAADGFLRPIYEGSISGYDHTVERRPYHRKCGCTLHSKSSKISCQNKSPICSGKIVYPIRRAWSEGNLALSASAYSSHSPSPSASPSPSPLGGVKSRRSYVDLESQFDDKICGLSEVNQSF